MRNVEGSIFHLTARVSLGLDTIADVPRHSSIEALLCCRRRLKQNCFHPDVVVRANKKL